MLQYTQLLLWEAVQVVGKDKGSGTSCLDLFPALSPPNSVTMGKLLHLSMPT